MVQRSKGGKRRVVGIGPAIKALLRQFLDHKEARGESVQADVPVFASDRSDGTLDPSAIWRAITRHTGPSVVLPRHLFMRGSSRAH